MIGTLGGTVGMFMGFSFLSAAEFVEFFVVAFTLGIAFLLFPRRLRRGARPSEGGIVAAVPVDVECSSNSKSVA